MAALIDRSKTIFEKCIAFAFACKRGYLRTDAARPYSTVTPVTLTSENLVKRGFFVNVFPDNRPDELQQLLSTPQGIYCGFDPTADSLHIGNLVSILALIHGQRAGHNPIAIMGGATCLIGDPSGKEKDREQMKAEDIENNILSLMENVERIFYNHAEYIDRGTRKLTPLRIFDNRDWYRDKDIITFMSTIARHFRLGEFISRTSIQSRLNSLAGISVTEAMYQLFQANDWLHLFQNHNCSIQVGGNDQTGNIKSGFDLIHRVTEKIVFGCMVPLLTTPSGTKLGKSSGNSLWLDPKKITPYEFYQALINLPDDSVEQYLRLLTFLSEEEIVEVMAQQNECLEKRHGQRKIAEQVTLLVHGESGLRLAEQTTEVLYGDAITHLRQMELAELQKLFISAPTSELAYDPQMSMRDLSLALGCFTKEKGAEITIKQGGFHINQEKVTDPEAVIGNGNFILPNNISLVRTGKKRYFIVKWLL